MPISVVCPGCATRLNASDDEVGKQVNCPKCQGAIPVAAEPNTIGEESNPQAPGVSGTRNLIGAVLLVVLVGVAGFVYYNKFGKKDAPPETKTNTPSNEGDTQQPLEMLPLPGDPTPAGGFPPKGNKGNPKRNPPKEKSSPT